MHASHGGTRSLGVVYTPPEVTAPMTRVALEPLLRGRSAEQILAPTICDPAIGEGAFLRAAVEVLVEHLGRAGLSDADARRAAPRCVHGVDIDPRAVAAARVALGLGAEHLQIADSLALDWPAAYPAVFARGGFDAVIGNPPYVRQEHLAAHKPLLRRFASYDGVADLYVYFVELAHQLGRPGARYCLITPNKWLTAAYARGLRAYLAAQRSVEGVVDLGRTALFDDADAFPCILWGTLDRIQEPTPPAPASASTDGAREPSTDAPRAAAELLSTHSSHALDSPLAVAIPLRRHERGVTSYPSPPPRAIRPPSEPGYPPAPSRDRPIRAARLPAGAALELGEVGAPHPRERWGAEPWHIDMPDDRALIDRLEARWPPLRALGPARPARGVVTGCNRAFVLERNARDQLLAAEPAAAPLIRPFVRGRDIRRWLPAGGERWILLVDRGTALDTLPRVAEHLAQFRSALEPRPPDWTHAWHGRKPGSYRWFELQDPVGPLVNARAPRLLYQDIQSGPACCIDRGGDVVPDTTVWMLPSEDLVLLAILNAPLYGWYARRRFPPALNGSVRPKRAHIANFPVATPQGAQRAAIEALVTERLALEPARHASRRTAAGAEALDAAIARAVHDAYELSAAERALITQV